MGKFPSSYTFSIHCRLTCHECDPKLCPIVGSERSQVNHGDGGGGRVHSATSWVEKEAGEQHDDDDSEVLKIGYSGKKKG